MNAEPLDIYLATLDAAEREHFPPRCAECVWAQHRVALFEDALYMCVNPLSDYLYVPEDQPKCSFYEQRKSPSDGLEDIY